MTKVGICEVHKHALGDTGDKIIKWYEVEKMWMCCSCERNTLLQAMARINKNIEEGKK